MIRKKEYRYGEPSSYIEIEMCQQGRYGAPGKKRGKRMHCTPEQVRKQNQRNKENRIRRYLRANFRKNDYWVTATYRPGDRPGDFRTAKKQVQKFIRKVRGEYRKAGEELKYICSVEIGERGGVHLHMVINRVKDADTVLSGAWRYGHIHITLMYEEGGFQELAEYIGKPGEWKWYSHSRNLAYPTVRIKKLKDSAWKRYPAAYTGYYIEKSSVVSGFNPITGRPFLHYAMARFCRD